MDKRQRVLVGGGLLALVGLGLHKLLAKAVPPGPPEPGTALIYGVVRDKDTNAPIVDVIVYEPWVHLLTKTNANGFYEIRDIPPGDYEFAFSEEYGRYQIQIIQVSLVADEPKELNLSMTRILPADKAIIRGTATDAVTGDGLHGYNVKLNGFEDSVAPDGSFRIENIEPGTYTLTISDFLSDPRHMPYETVVTLSPGEIKEMDIKMHVVPGVGFRLKLTNYPPELQYWWADAGGASWDYDPYMGSDFLAPDAAWIYPADPQGAYIRFVGVDMDNEPLFYTPVNQGPIEDGADYHFNVGLMKLIRIWTGW